jgi:hypothetical protein
MLWVGLEPTIPAFERAETVHALDCAATVIGSKGDRGIIYWRYRLWPTTQHYFVISLKWPRQHKKIRGNIWTRKSSNKKQERYLCDLCVVQWKRKVTSDKRHYDEPFQQHSNTTVRLSVNCMLGVLIRREGLGLSYSLLLSFLLHLTLTFIASHHVR